jgi:hypothetical protein
MGRPLEGRKHFGRMWPPGLIRRELLPMCGFGLLPVLHVIIRFIT